MNYNTEMIKQIAGQLAEMIVSGIKADQEEGKEVTIAAIEKGMREVLREIGEKALGEVLSGQQEAPEKKIQCECGGELTYQRMREASVISVFGKVRYKRAYYAGCKCGEGKAPLDEAYGLKPGAVTAGLSALLSLGGIGFSYDESTHWVEEFLLFRVAGNTVRSETEQMGALQAHAEEKLIEQSQKEEYLQERERQPGVIPQRLYGSMDAAKVRIETRAKKDQPKPEQEEDWRDMKALCWYEVETVPPAQRSARHRAKLLRAQPVLRAKNKTYCCDITEAETFGKLLWATGCQRNADLCPELIFLGDGAVWIWNLVLRYYPNAVQIVDWFHAEEHLEEVATAAFSDLAERATWLEDAKQNLWDGLVEDVIRACHSLASTCLKAQQAATYFSNNIDRMRYDVFRQHGYMIGSGTIESACKQLVSHRLDLPGAQWTVSGAVQTAKARAVWLSDQWQQLCDLRSALPLAA